MADYLTADEVDESKELVKLLIGMDFKNANLLALEQNIETDSENCRNLMS